MDYAGTLNLIGTPGPVPAGFFYECGKTESNWSKHHWTFWDNPFIIKKSKTSHQQMLNRELTLRGVTEADPSIRREWFGEWVNDSDSLLIHYDPSKNHYIDLPKLPNNAPYNYIMGIDLGFDDADAIAILAWSEHTPSTYLVHETVVNGQGLTELVGQINGLRKQYDISKMVIDQGGLGKKLAEEMRRQHHIPVQPADKSRKMETVKFLNDALRTGRFMAKSASKFAQDSYLVEIDKDKSTPDRIAVSSRYHSDIIDSVIYSFKESPAFAYQAPKARPIPGSPEWAKQQTDDMFEAALEHFTAIAEMTEDDIYR